MVLDQLEIAPVIVTITYAALLGGICMGSMHWLLGAWETMPLVPKMVWLGLTIGVAGAVFFVSATLFNIDEVDEVVDIGKRKLARLTKR